MSNIAERSQSTKDYRRSLRRFRWVSRDFRSIRENQLNLGKKGRVTRMGTLVKPRRRG